jgi:hypothetical protein
MNATKPSEFKHTSLASYPNKTVGITLLDESPGITGIYVRDENGGLWPARTVNRTPPEHHQRVCDSWLARPGIHQDRRSS